MRLDKFTQPTLFPGFPIVHKNLDGHAPAAEVREKFKRVKPLKEISAQQRGWTLDMLNIVRRLVEEKRASALECGGTPPLSLDATRRVIPKRGHVRALQNEFTTADVYTFTRELETLHPDT